MPLQGPLTSSAFKAAGALGSLAPAKGGFAVSVNLDTENARLLLKESEPAIARALRAAFKSGAVKMRKGVRSNTRLNRRSGKMFKGIVVKSFGKKNIDGAMGIAQFNWYASVHEFGGAVPRKGANVKGYTSRTGQSVTRKTGEFGVSKKTGKRFAKRRKFNIIRDVPAHMRRPTVAQYQPRLGARREWNKLVSSGEMDTLVAKSVDKAILQLVKRRARSGQLGSFGE